MGFFDRVVKFFLAMKEPVIAGPAETRSDNGPERFPTLSLSAVPPVPDAITQISPGTPVLEVAVLDLAAVPEKVESPYPLLAPIPTSDGGALFEGDFDEDLDDIFASLVNQSDAPESQSAQGEMIADDQFIVENLFADIAANYARPVKNFIFELKRGTAVKDWVGICRPAMRGITRAAEGMGLGIASQRMLDFEAALTLAQASEQRLLAGEVRDLLLRCYEDLVEVMPQAFLVCEEEQQREGIIITSLLRQIPDVGQVTIERLYSAGLTSLETLFLAQRDDLAVATGIPSRLSARICERFQAYRAELQEGSRDVADSGQRTRLAALLVELRHQHKILQPDSESQAFNASDKRKSRRQRQSYMLKINILLAETGELDLVNELHKLSFKRRLRRLEEHLASPPVAL